MQGMLQPPQCAVLVVDTQPLLQQRSPPPHSAPPPQMQEVPLQPSAVVVLQAMPQPPQWLTDVRG